MRLLFCNKHRKIDTAFSTHEHPESKQILLNRRNGLSLMTLLFSIAIISLLPTTSFSAETADKLTHLDHSIWDAIPSEDISYQNSDALTVKSLTSKTHRLYLWIGKSYPPNDGNALFLKHLQKTGNVWYLDTPDALFLPRTRTALRNLKGDFLVPLLQKAVTTYQEVIIISSDVAAVPTLRGIRQWQVATTSDELRNHLKSVVLMFPNLYINTPAAGSSRALFPIASESALPITLLNAERGAQANQIEETVKALRSGGSLVQTVTLMNSTDSEYRYHNIKAMAKLTAETLVESVNQQLLNAKRIGYTTLALQPSEDLKNPPVSSMIRGMKTFDPPIPMPSNIILHDLDGNIINVQKDYAGKALLINFWATWCPHCVEEIPSMNRALAQLGDTDFSMVSVSYREPKSVLEAFTQKLAVDFPILMDEQGKVASKWKVFAFPSSFLVDKHGMIRYSINAGNIWDTDEMMGYLRQLDSNDPTPKKGK